MSVHLCAGVRHMEGNECRAQTKTAAGPTASGSRNANVGKAAFVTWPLYTPGQNEKRNDPQKAAAAAVHAWCAATHIYKVLVGVVRNLRSPNKVGTILFKVVQRNNIPIPGHFFSIAVKSKVFRVPGRP